jgi:predicted Zn-dependent protease
MIVFSLVMLAHPSMPLFLGNIGMRSTSIHKAVLLLMLAIPAISAGQSDATSGTATASPADTLKALRKEVDSGHAAQALSTISQMRTAGSTQPGLSRIEGLADYANGDLRSADTAFAAAVVQDPSDMESIQMRGLTLFRLGRPADAIPLLEASRKSPLTKADPNYVLALCYMDTRRYDDARHAFAAQYGFAADSAPAYLVSARMLLRREYLPISQAFAEKSLQLDPTLPLAHELLGEIALAQNHLEVAISELEKERMRNPLDATIYDRLGDAYVRSTRYDDAQRTLQEAILLQPNSTGPYILLGKTMLKKADPLAAATYLEHAVQLDPANYMSHSLLGQAYRLMGKTEDAARETETAQKLQAASEPKFENGR